MLFWLTKPVGWIQNTLCWIFKRRINTTLKLLWLVDPWPLLPVSWFPFALAFPHQHMEGQRAPWTRPRVWIHDCQNNVVLKVHCVRFILWEYNIRSYLPHLYTHWPLYLVHLAGTWLEPLLTLLQILESQQKWWLIRLRKFFWSVCVNCSLSLLFSADRSGSQRGLLLL